MDPASATSLAAAILQLASFTGKVLSRSQELYKAADGALLRHTELSSVAKNFQEILQRLEFKKFSSGENVTVKKTALDVLVIEAQAVTQELLVLLRRLTSQPGPNLRWKSVRQAVLTLWKDSQLQELEQRLDRYRNQIDSALTHDLREYVVEIQDEQRKHAENVRGYLNILVDNSKEDKALLQALRASATKTQSAGLEVPQVFATHLLASVNEGDCKKREQLLAKQILESLWFRDMPTRHKTIPRAYETTFNWAFSKPEQNNTEYKWASFADWFQGNDNLYWIAGKPGAGKSTLMKYLFDNPRATMLVKSWPKTSDYNVATAGFFFWNSGSELQMSRAGFMRSMLTQLWDESMDVADLFPNRWKRCELFGWSEDPFTWEELLLALDTLLAAPDRYFLLFVDGLDEFEGDKDELADLVLKLSSKPFVKICAASRPWVEFESKFHGVPRLQMENLTHGDIAAYVGGQFSNSREFRAMQRFEPQRAALLREDIIKKASGVFLWVYVVVNTLLHGLRDGDRMKDLIEKLDSLPPELDELFEKILGQLDPKNRRESSELFQFVRSNPDKSTLIGLYWSQLTLREALESEIRAMPEDVARYHAEVMQRNVLSRCKCLLNAEGRIRSTTPVTWLHRTAREYLERVDVWTMIKNQSPHYDPEKALGLSLLRQAKAGITSHSDRLLCEALLQFKTLHLLEDQIAFLDEIEKTGMTTCGITPTSDNSHTIYWLWASDVPGFYSDHSTLDGYTTVFHVAIVLDWDWYVQHRLVLDPSLLHKDVANHMALDALMLAVAKDLWDMQYLCLQRGSDPKKLCQTHFLKLGIGKTAWQVMLEGVGDQLQGVHSTVPWAKVVRNSAAFLKHGADPYAELEGYQMKAVIADILKHAKGAASDEDVKYIKEACLQRHKGFLLWRR